MPGISVEEMELVGRAAGGDVAAFGELVRRYQDRVYNLAYRLVGNADDAADVAQEAFLAAFEGLVRFRAESALYTWLYRIVVNKALSARRNRSSRSSLMAADDPSRLETAQDASPSPLEAAETAESVRLVRQAVARLDDDHRAVVVLKDIEGLEYEEIADVLDVPLGTVKSRLHRARLNLRDALKRCLGTTP